MAKFNEYTQKATPEDADTLMIYDAAAKANKLSPFSGIWNWIVGKLTNAVISNLQTSNQTVIGAINELNSKPFKFTGLESELTELEKTFQATSDYSTFSGSSKVGKECGFYGYKHTNDKAASCIVFSRDHVYVCVRDHLAKTWTPYIIK